ncbi:MAG: cytochrome c biogenesis protein ResB [Acidobacteria bacterium]|nr:cytochrome c biogenesis protein ResB [Acidobacteriota bacterium]
MTDVTISRDFSRDDEDFPASLLGDSGLVDNRVQCFRALVGYEGLGTGVANCSVEIMSTLDQHIPETLPVSALKAKRGGIVERVMKFFSSVKFGVVLLILLGLACFIGMVIMQQSVDGFDRYLAELTPAQRLVYGRLGFFDIYHAWYFEVLLFLLSVNIILSSIERFPKTWRFYSKPSVTPPVRWLKEQRQTAEVELAGETDAAVARVKGAMAGSGFGRIRTATKGAATYVFGESGVWNRLGAYPVHVALLTIFVGGFMTGEMGSTGNMVLAPGVNTDLMSETVLNLDKATQVTKKLPFSVICTDIQQKLLKKDGTLSAQNTIDWITKIRINDEGKVTEGTVQMNRPFDYRGYRFFQASFVNVGRARTVTLAATPANGGEPQTIQVPRNGSATLPDGTEVSLTDFKANFTMNQQQDDEDESSDYSNPGAILSVAQPGQPSQTAYAFTPAVGNIPVASKPVGGYTFKLVDFEKVADQHILAVQRDPGATVVYVGFALLFVTLVSVFFFSHKRVWAVITPNGDTCSVVLGGNTNRSQNAFDEKFAAFAQKLRGQS